MYVSHKIRCQIRGKNGKKMVNVCYSKFSFKLEDVLIFTTKTYITMHRYVHYDSIAIYFVLYIFLQGITVSSFYGKINAGTRMRERMRVIEEIPASSSDSDSDSVSDEDEEVIFRQHGIEAASEDSSTEEEVVEEEEMDPKTKKAKAFR